jgi:hypothetical protein
MIQSIFETYDLKCKRLVVEYLQNNFPHLSDFKFSTDNYAHWDGKFISGNSIVIFYELKGRNFPSTKYNDSLLEQYKYDELLKLSSKCREYEVNHRIFYINTFTDGVISIMDVTNYNKSIDWIPLGLDKTTIVESEKVIKSVAKIPLKNIKTIKTNLNF